MDFLDPKKQKAHKIRLLVGYVLIAIALGLATTILVYQVSGYGLKNGKIVQNGLVFVSSTPKADIYVNGVKKDTTNARLAIEAGQYTVDLKRPGYNDWKRAVSVQGGIIEHFDYPFLFPTQLTTSTVKKYTTQPSLVSQSPDRRWLIVQDGNTAGTFDEFDTKSPQKVVSTQFTLPDAAFTKGDGAQTWQLVEWASDNRHVLLQHTFQKSGQTTSEYVLVDRQDPTQSVNLTTVLGSNPSQIDLRNNQYDQYYEYNQATDVLSTATLKVPAPQLYLEHVLSFKSYGSNIVLFATDQSPSAGKVAIKLRDGNNTYTIRTVAAGSQYLLNLTQYGGNWFVAAGASSEDKVYVYKNPEATLKDATNVLVPVQILKISAPNYVSFSQNAQFIMAENSDHFATYDVKNDKTYAYQIKTPLDAPQPHATWMDGDRLALVSNGQTLVFDYDSANQRILSPASATSAPFFDEQYEALYSIALQTTKIGTDAAAASTTLAAAPQFQLTKTYLRTTDDL